MRRLPFTKRTWILLAVLGVAVALPLGCGGGGSDVMQPNVPAADVVITVSGINGGMSFSPNPATVQVGQTVAWHNTDTITHTATQDGGTFSTGAIPAGVTSAPITMGSVGALAYHCSIHPSMTGTLNVTN